MWFSSFCKKRNDRIVFFNDLLLARAGNLNANAHTLATSARKMAGSAPEKSVGEPTNNLPFSVISVVIFACGLNGHLATPLSNSVSFKLSICKLSAIANTYISIAIRMSVFLFGAAAGGDSSSYKYTYLTPRTIRTECVCATSVQSIAVVLQNHNVIATVGIAGTFALAYFHYFVGRFPHRFLVRFQRKWQTVQCVAAREPENETKKKTLTHK